MKRLLILALASSAIGCATDRTSRTEPPPNQIQQSAKVKPLMGGVIPSGQVATTSTPAEVTTQYPSFATQGKFR